MCVERISSRKSDMTISQTEAQRLFRYNHDTGVVTRRVDVDMRIKAGAVVGYRGNEGYLRVGIEGTYYLVHRLVWLYVHGVWPNIIDHINGIRDDNRIRNLRSVTHKENHHNQKTPNSNTSGVMGVSLHKKTGKWQATISVEGKPRYLGLYNIKEDAIATRKSAEVVYGYHPNHGRA